jgi:hypothetical protein
VEDREQGLASGLINTSNQIGGALGLAVLSTIATTRTDNVLATGHSTLPNALTEGFQAAVREQVVGQAVALSGRSVAIERDRALTVEVRRDLVVVQVVEHRRQGLAAIERFGERRLYVDWTETRTVSASESGE